MDAITLGSPNLFVKGIAEQIIYDPTTGNIINYDNLASDAAMTSNVNMQEVTAGIGNALAGVLPDTTRLSGTYTSQGFSLQQRALIAGSSVSYGAVAPYCDNGLTSLAGGEVTLSKTPVSPYWGNGKLIAFVREHGANTYLGQAVLAQNTGTGSAYYFVNVSEIFPDVKAGDVFDVTYFISNASAQVLPIPTNFNPPVVAIQQKYGVYSNTNNSTSNGTFQGWLYLIIPLAKLTGNVGLDASQTQNSTTDGSWIALRPDQTPFECNSCLSDGSNYAYYIYAPCGDVADAAVSLTTIGGGINLAVGESKQIPVVFIMPDGSVQTPSYTDFKYTSSSSSIASVSPQGEVNGAGVGSTAVTISYPKTGKAKFTTTCNIIVTNA